VFRTVYVDPFSGAVLSDGDIVSMQWFFRHLHMRFFLPDHGILLVGLFGVTLLVSTVTGVLTFKKWWRNAFRMRLGKGRRVFWGDFHRSSGVWSLWFLILISLTGIWYGVEELLHDAGRTLPYPPFPKVIEIPADAATRSPIPVDAAIAAAQAALPGLEPGALRLSITPSDPIVVHGLTGEVLVRDRINAVFVNPYDGQVIEIWSAAEAGLATRWVHTVDRLHFGDFGGLIVKLVWFVAGLTVTVQIISGSWLWCRHRRTKQTSEARRLSPPPSAGRTGALAVSPRLLDSLHREEKYRSRP